MWQKLGPILPASVLAVAQTCVQPETPRPDTELGS